MTITSDRLLQGIKRRISQPANQVLINDAGMLQIADDITRDRLVPTLLSVNQNFFVYEETEQLVTDQRDYRIPYRSIGRGLRDLKLSQSDSDTSIWNMALIALEDAHMFAPSGVPSGFYFMGDKIALVPVPSDDGYYLRKYYDLQPNRLVKTTDAGLVTGISDNVVTCSIVPTTFVAGVEVDFIQGKAGCATLAMDVAITNVAGTQVTFASSADIPSDLVIGDYIALAQETPVVQLPDEASPLLETCTAERILYAVGDFEGSAKLLNDAQMQEMNLKKIIAPRVEGETTKIVNRRGLLRGKGFSYWRLRGGYYGS